MIYDMRTYEIAPGRVADYMKNVKEIAIPIRRDHGVKLGGWYYSEVGPLNQVWHIWAYEDTKHLVEGAEAVRADPRWRNDYMPSNRGLVQSQRDAIVVQPAFAPTSYEPVDSAEPRLYDMRIYDIKPGRIPEYMSAVEQVGLPIREELGVKLAGWFYSDVGTLNQVVHIWAYDDSDDLHRKMRAVYQHPGWAGDYVPRVSGLLDVQRDQLMRGGDFFPGP